jgi:hypothetical protein
MAEFKPKQDDQRAGDAKSTVPQPSKESKAHGDKLQDAVDEAARKPREKH